MTPRILKIEEPAEIRNYLVWVEKGEKDDWGRLPDDVYNTSFYPNRACVVVTQNGKGFHASWMQVREHVEGPGWERCNGTYEVNNDSRRPVWAYVVEDLAVAAVKAENTTEAMT